MAPEEFIVVEVPPEYYCGVAPSKVTCGYLDGSSGECRHPKREHDANFAYCSSPNRIFLRQSQIPEFITWRLKNS